MPFDRSIALWLRAYPRRWRLARGAEVAEVLRDLAAPGVDRVDLRSALGLLRGGWTTRLRERPPLHTYLAYRFLEQRIPLRYRDWARDDIEGPLYFARSLLWSQGLLVVAFTVSGAWRVYSSGVLVAYCAALVLIAAFGRIARKRELVVLKHLTARPGEAVRIGDLVEGYTSRPRLDAVAGIGVAMVVAGVAAAAWSAAALNASLGATFLACPGVAQSIADSCAESGVGPLSERGHQVAGSLVLLGAIAALVAAWAARRRLTALVRDCPEQPFREMVPMSPAVRFWSAAAAAAIVGEAWLEATDRFVISISLVGAPVATVVLACLVTARLSLRGREVSQPGARAVETPLAFIDLWRIAVLGKTARQDGMRPAAVPFRGVPLESGAGSA